MVLRQLLSVAILPFTVTVLVPWWLRPRHPVGVNNDNPVPEWKLVLTLVGVVIVVVGLVLFLKSVSRFSKEGDGTLAPWDPPRKFVVTGPYRFVRNPMISGVVLILFGEAAVIQRMQHLWWAVIFLAANLIMIPLLEEPMLRARFGAPYEEYCRHVGRLIPRLTPWSPREG
jgi:protein-S-isoprenylcysteine O-methyltransferase Ste14